MVTNPDVVEIKVIYPSGGPLIKARLAPIPEKLRRKAKGIGEAFLMKE